MLALFASLSLLPGARSDTPPPGNILILVADDLGLDQVHAYGLAPNPPPTPNLDRLASDGVLFRNAWSQPTCSPTRATIQTGRYGFRTGIGAMIDPFTGGPALALSEVTLPEMLDLGTGARYAHAAIGKWHLATSQNGGNLAPNLAGYAHFAGSIEGQLNSFTYWQHVVDGVATNTRDYATSVCVDDALGWIQSQPQDRPWLCVVNFQAPHAPYHRPPPGLFTETLPGQDPRALCNSVGGDPYPFFRAMIEALDHEIGRLLANLPADDVANTTVLFLGDNGTDPCMVRAPFPPEAKGTLYQGGVNVPLIASGYRVTGRGVSASLVNTSDLFATVAELAGVDLAATLPGYTLDSRSFAPCLADPRRRVREWLYAETFTQNGPGHPVPLPPCPSSAVCQSALGLDGPGSATLTSCGPPLYGRYGANAVPWLLSGARPQSRAWLLIGADAPAFEPRLGAWIASRPPALVLPFVVGSSGTLASWTWTGSTSTQPIYQFVVRDPTQPLGFSVSDALRMDLLWTDMQAVRGSRYKLIRFDPCTEELYDLALDPYEHTNLLARGLSTAERAAYDALTRVLDGIR